MNNVEIPSYWIPVDGLSVHYKCLGGGIPVVLLHGGGNDWHEWKNNINELATKYQVIVPDLPGFGLSQPPDKPVSPQWFTSFLKNFLDTLKLYKVVIMGHSVGAMIAIAFGAENPQYINKMVLVDAGGIGKLSLMGRILISIFRTTDRWQKKRRGHLILAGSETDWMVADKLPEIKCPVLILWGQRDPYLPASQARVASHEITHAKLHIFPHCGHAPQRECTDEFNQLVLEFLLTEGHDSSPCVRNLKVKT